MAEILGFPDNLGLIMNHLWARTLRLGDANVFFFYARREYSDLTGCGNQVVLPDLLSLGNTTTPRYMFRSVSNTLKVACSFIQSATTHAPLVDQSVG